MKTKPSKPSSPLGHAIFSKSGKVSIVHEELPAEKEALEFVIASKFIEAIGRRFNRILHGLQRGDRFPDFWAVEGETKIALEVAEVVDQEHAKTGLAHVQSRWVPVDYPQTLLFQTIQNKIAKNYSSSSDAKTWLLVYDNSGALGGDNAKAARVANEQLMITSAGVFDEIWLIWPMTGDVLSFIESVWPDTEYTSTARRP